MDWLEKIPKLETIIESKNCLFDACEYGKFSPDPSTKNGAYLTTKNNSLFSWNDFPNGLFVKDRWDNRDLKYLYVVHAESSIIAKAASKGIKIDSAKLYVPFYACNECAKLIIASGISEVHGSKKIMELVPDRWKKSIRYGISMLMEAGVKCYLYDGLIGSKMLFNGEMIEI